MFFPSTKSIELVDIPPNVLYKNCEVAWLLRVPVRLVVHTSPFIGVMIACKFPHTVFHFSQWSFRSALSNGFPPCQSMVSLNSSVKYPYPVFIGLVSSYTFIAGLARKICCQSNALCFLFEWLKFTVWLNFNHFNGVCSNRALMAHFL